MYNMEIILKGPPGKTKNNIHKSHCREQWSTTEKEAHEDGESPWLWMPNGSHNPPWSPRADGAVLWNGSEGLGIKVYVQTYRWCWESAYKPDSQVANSIHK